VFPVRNTAVIGLDDNPDELSVWGTFRIPTDVDHGAINGNGVLQVLREPERIDSTLVFWQQTFRHPNEWDLWAKPTCPGFR
jgi:hypothetical protein